MIKVFRYLLYTLFIPFWWLQLIIPRNRNIWIFGAWFGEKFSDNSRALIEYIRNEHAEIKTVWLSRNVKVIEHLRKEGICCYNINSVKGIYFSLIAKYIVVSNSKRDINAFFINGGKSVQLWHGVPMKKIGVDSKQHTLSILQKILFKYFFPFKYEYNYSNYLSTSPIFDSIICTAFVAQPEKLIHAGYPRNDMLKNNQITDSVIKNLKEDFKDAKVIGYFPTHRGDYISNIDYFTNNSFDKNRFNQFLHQNNLLFVYKGHFFVNEKKKLELDDNSDNRIYQVLDDEMLNFNSLLVDVDILITDYSGAYFDFLLTQKPIIFFPYDLKEYMSDDRGLYFDYFRDIVCGPVVYNWEEVIVAIQNLIKHDDYKEKRKNKNKQYNFYCDNKNSERIFQQMYLK
ncbi:CDP-glycerol glycerophosphotransferase family protein [Saccharicrinis sp. FJH2]|uniref:CDP-glycerol glycerophosphotransferase family protein n=1 Tax=Saccharicrinis sp. FJH65 TaxID=3344659 RepID=UPI0035F30EA8